VSRRLFSSVLLVSVACASLGAEPAQERALVRFTADDATRELAVRISVD